MPQDESTAAAGEGRQATQGMPPVEDSLAILWDVVSALHDSGWQEDDLPKAIPRLWKSSLVEQELSNLSSLSLPEDLVGSDTIPKALTRMGPCEAAACSGMDVGSTRCEGACSMGSSCFVLLNVLRVVGTATTVTAPFF